MFMLCYDILQPRQKLRIKSAAMGFCEIGNKNADTTPSITGVHSIQDLILCVKTGVYIFFWVHRGF